MALLKLITVLYRGSIKPIHIIGVALVAFALPVFCLADSGTKMETVQAEKAEPLTGAQLWTINCSRCHMYRSSGEFTAAQWQPILLHMRVRANIPAAQVREILKFLESGAGK